MIEKNLDTSILLSIYETAVLLIKKNIEFVSERGLTNQQWVILIHLAKDPNLPYFIREKHDKPMMASELADSLGVTRANITNLLTVLMEKKLLKQFEDDQDRRKKRLMLTPKGEKLIASMQSERLSSNAAMLKGLKNKEKAEFLRYLQKCTENVQKING